MPTSEDMIVECATQIRDIARAHHELNDRVIDTRNCLQALCSAIARQASVDHGKLQQDFLELAERVCGGPDKVSEFAKVIARTAFAHGQGKT